MVVGEAVVVLQQRLVGSTWVLVHGLNDIVLACCMSAWPHSIVQVHTKACAPCTSM
jgi:hypothetical protein